jgi:hypothetical protein
VRAEDARTRASVGERAVDDVDLDPERGGKRTELALRRERRVAARHRDRADHRRVRPLEPRALEPLA